MFARFETQYAQPNLSASPVKLNFGKQSLADIYGSKTQCTTPHIEDKETNVGSDTISFNSFPDEIHESDVVLEQPVLSKKKT